MNQPAQRAIKKKSRPAEAHHLFNPTSHLRSVAVNRTPLTGRLILAERTNFKPFVSIPQKFSALGTEFPLLHAVLFPAVNFKHFPYCSFFPFQPAQKTSPKLRSPRRAGTKEERSQGLYTKKLSLLHYVFFNTVRSLNGIIPDGNLSAGQAFNLFGK